MNISIPKSAADLAAVIARSLRGIPGAPSVGFKESVEWSASAPARDATESDVDLAIRIASQVHDGQYSTTGFPYMGHAARVAQRALVIAQPASSRGELHSIWPAPTNADWMPDVAVAALLHDAAEESLWPGWSRPRHSGLNRPFVDLTYLLEAGFSARAAIAVMALTPRPRQSRAEYRDQVAIPTMNLFKGVSERDEVNSATALERAFGTADPTEQQVRQFMQDVRRIAFIVKDADIEENLHFSLSEEVFVSDLVCEIAGSRVIMERWHHSDWKVKKTEVATLATDEISAVHESELHPQVLPDRDKLLRPNVEEALKDYLSGKPTEHGVVIQGFVASRAKRWRKYQRDAAYLQNASRRYGLPELEETFSNTRQLAETMIGFGGHGLSANILGDNANVLVVDGGVSLEIGLPEVSMNISNAS